MCLARDYLTRTWYTKTTVLLHPPESPETRNAAMVRARDHVTQVATKLFCLRSFWYSGGG